MFVVLIESGGVKNIANVIYGKDIEVVKDWVYNYLIKRVQSMESLSIRNTLGYKILENENIKNKYSLIREYKQTVPGYIYNSYKTEFETILECTILEYRDQNLQINKKKYLEEYNKMVKGYKQKRE